MKTFLELPAVEDRKRKGLAAASGQVHEVWPMLPGIRGWTIPLAYKAIKNTLQENNRAGASEADSSRVFSTVLSPLRRFYTEYFYPRLSDKLAF